MKNLVPGLYFELQIYILYGTSVKVMRKYIHILHS